MQVGDFIGGIDCKRRMAVRGFFVEWVELIRGYGASVIAENGDMLLLSSPRRLGKPTQSPPWRTLLALHLTTNEIEFSEFERICGNAFVNPGA